MLITANEGTFAITRLIYNTAGDAQKLGKKSAKEITPSSEHHISRRFLRGWLSCWLYIQSAVRRRSAWGENLLTPYTDVIQPIVEKIHGKSFRSDVENRDGAGQMDASRLKISPVL